MSSPSRHHAASPTALTISASRLAVFHTYLSFAAFFSALFIGVALHYKKIVKNGVAGYPEEWFPSVSATIGDWYPERNIFQILIALNSGPRFAILLLQHHLQKHISSTLPKILLCTGILRTLSCGGWVYITSTDDHDWHDILMISYIILNVPWMYGGIAVTRDDVTRRRRRNVANSFFFALIPMIYFFIQHKVHRIPGAYTYYSFFEWSLIILDILYDALARYDFEAANLQITVGRPENAKEAYQPIASKKTEAKSESNTPAAPIVYNVKKDGVANGSLVQVNQIRGVSQTRRRLSQPVAFICDVYLSYINWSVFTSLTPTLFYFSVWELGIAGSELSLLSTLSPIVLGISVLRDIASSRVGRTMLYSLTLVGLWAYLLDSPVYRLFAVAFASMALCIGWAIDWSTSPVKMGYQSLVFGLGLFLSSISKHANHSNNPVWPIVNDASGGYNKTGILLACLAIYNYYSRQADPSRDIAPTPKDAKSSDPSSPSPSRSTWLRDGLALGSLLYTLHCFVTDSSTLIAWSWTGYPALGLLVAAYTGPSFGAHSIWFAYGSVSATVMYLCKDWLGYFGGWNFALFQMSIIPTMLASASSNKNQVKTYFTAFLVAALFDVVSTFTVAYAFVPSGEIFRERTNYVLFAQMACLANVFRWPRLNPSVPGFSLSKTSRIYIKNTVAILSIVSLLVTMYRAPVQSPVPYRPGPRILRAGIWTVHFGIDDKGRDSQRRMRNLVRDMELDIVGLLETDLHRVVYGNRDLTRVMLEDIGYYVDLGPGPNSHTWGAVLLSKFPILNSTHHLLPSPHGELAPAIHAVLDVFGTNVHVVVAHNGQEETPLDRELQATELARIMSEAYPEPLIFLGYVVTKPHAQRPAPYDIMVTDGRVHDIDKDDYDRWCEYIFYRGLYRTSYARVSRSTITDTELQIGQFLLPKHGTNVTDESVQARYMRAWKEELPPEHWFPQEYYPDTGGVRGHFYHVFNTPLYYKIPEGAII